MHLFCISYGPRENRQKVRFLKNKFSDLNSFLHVGWHKKNKKYGHTKFFENTVSKLFIAAQTFRVSSISTYTFYHSSVNFCSRTKCLGSFERYFNRQFYKNKKQEKQQQQHFFCFTWGY
jgi:hypothetical protein